MVVVVGGEGGGHAGVKTQTIQCEWEPAEWSQVGVDGLTFEGDLKMMPAGGFRCRISG